MINYTLNDPTQQMLIPHLKTTEELLSRVATKLSGVKKYAEITAMPDLGIVDLGQVLRHIFLKGLYTPPNAEENHEDQD